MDGDPDDGARLLAPADPADFGRLIEYHHFGEHVHVYRALAELRPDTRRVAVALSRGA